MRGKDFGSSKLQTDAARRFAKVADGLERRFRWFLLHITIGSNQVTTDFYPNSWTIPIHVKGHQIRARRFIAMGIPITARSFTPPQDTLEHVLDDWANIVSVDLEIRH